MPHMTIDPEGLRRAQDAMRTFLSREDILAAGYIEGWGMLPRPSWTPKNPRPIPTVKLGDRAVAFGYGQWRQGIVTSVTPTYVGVAYVAPSNPHVQRLALGDRTGTRGTNLYVLPDPAVVAATPTCGEVHPRVARWVCILTPGHPGMHEPADGPRWAQSSERLLATVDAIVRKVDPAGSVLQLKSQGPAEDHGIVLWRRAERFEPYVVHRWAIAYTDGSPMPTPGILYSGGYHDTYEDAVADFDGRAPARAVLREVLAADGPRR